MNIAIDGPAGAGKSTVAKTVAKKCGYIYVDTGAMYRAMALYVLRHGIAKEDKEKVEDACDDINVSIAYENGEQQVYLNGENVTGMIRTEEVSQTTSTISTYSRVRETLLSLQRDLAAKHDVVMDGRDIGTHVLPNADVKIYLTASPEVRAKRRFDEYKAKGIECDLKELEEEIRIRDDRDMHRDVAPLRQAEDAHFLDSSSLSIEEVCDTILNFVKKA